ncbi:DUF177 domain-containing protein [Roseovarius sp. A21]|uniref:DUF177 domain-containing protein n=1 Tax=Roseovarius bejariae TaxID=2576383 RepID=A0A844CKF3_9RHOB|nr:DUF177 domain-containing protein [Roseovarius bejariae]MRU13965.1 DUF177 domain-containing protein [Roseovarius bejariae]
MPENTSETTVLRVSDLSQSKPHRFSLRPDRPAMEAIASQLSLTGLRKLSFSGELRPDRGRDWRLEGTLGATVTQPCVVSLEPVTTRLDVQVTRRFLDEMPHETASAEEIEMAEDETIDPLGSRIDLEAVMIEALALALPDYPRKEDNAPVEAEFTPPGARPIEEERQKPFAGLADLKKKLESDD